MKKGWIVIMFTLVLAACGNTEEESSLNANKTIVVYENDKTLTHNMEGVSLTLDYSVQKITGEDMEKSLSTNLQAGDFLLEITGTIENEFEQEIYYTPNFEIETGQQVKLEQVSSSVNNEQILVNSQTVTSFTVAYELREPLYSENATLNIRIPAAFKEPNSESSGDALGDSTTWEIPIN